MAQGRTFRDIIVASDLGAGSDEALGAAAVLASATGARLHVFHCVAAGPAAEAMFDERRREDRMERTRAELDGQVRATLASGRMPTSVVLSEGDPAREVERRAAQVGADLLVLGSHRPRRALDGLLGTTADRLLRTAGRPCLLAHRPLADTPHRVLAATDFSPCSLLACRRAGALLADVARTHPRAHPLVLELLHVRPFESLREGALGAEQRLTAVAEEVRREVVRGMSIEVRVRVLSAPLPVDGILRAAEDTAPDLLVLGSHGHGGRSRALVGAVASETARAVPLPTMLVPPDVPPDP